MYPSKRYDFATDCSSVDADRPDHARYPLFQQVAVSELVLEPGDLLFLPRRWWHYVRSLAPSISVNTFGATLVELTAMAPVFGKDVLHHLRLYRRGWCTCHVPVHAAG
jgi:lysine-specific demethylase 8